MKKAILLIIILLFLITGMGFAFQNEPDGFRGLKWGDAPIKGMHSTVVIIHRYSGKGNLYRRLKKELNIGSVELYAMKYLFNLRSNQFYEWEGSFSDEDDFDVLMIILEDKYGKPTYTSEYGRLSSWEGDKTYIEIEWYEPFVYSTWSDYRMPTFIKRHGTLTFRSVKISQEDPPEINEQEEIEKAKEDF